MTLVSYAGGQIFVDDKPVGTDATGVLTLKAGTHKIRVQNKFLGDHETTVEIADGQRGTVVIEW